MEQAKEKFSSLIKPLMMKELKMIAAMEDRPLHELIEEGIAHVLEAHIGTSAEHGYGFVAEFMEK